MAENTEQEMSEMQEFQEEMQDDMSEEQFENNLDLNEEYDVPNSQELQNQHSFLNQAVFKNQNSLKVGYLDDGELGRPVFTVRFLLDMKSLAKHYLGHIAEQLDVKNEIEEYFGNKVINITDSSMSKDGFTMNLNVTKKVDSTRKKMRGNIDNINKGKKKPQKE